MSLGAERSLEPAEEIGFYCPVCGAEEPELIFTIPGEGVVGCDLCLCAYEPWEYFEKVRGGEV